MDALTASSVPEFRPQRPWRALLASGIVASAGLIWLVRSSTTSEPDTVAALPPARPLAAPSRTPAAVAPATAVPVPTTEATGTNATKSNSAGFTDSFKSALSGTSDMILVAVHISPPDALVFKSGRRLGTGDVTVNVVPGTKTTLVAQLDGYTPRTVVLDGTNTSVNIVLRRAPAGRATDTSSQSKPNNGAATGDAPSNSTSPSGFNPYD
jgi:hypothetical protein